METRLRWGNTVNEHQLAETEALLRASLKPVEPRPDYVRSLKGRLLFPADAPQLSKEEPALMHLILLIVASLLSGGFVLVVGIKGVAALLEAIGKWQQVRRPLKPEAAPPLHPAI